MAKYKTKPLVIDAIEWTGEADEIRRFWSENYKRVTSGNVIIEHDKLYIETGGELVEVVIGDMIVCGANGEFFSCKPDVFEKTYEPILVNVLVTVEDSSEVKWDD